MSAAATAIEETPSMWAVSRLFRCSACRMLFVVRRMLGRPDRCPECNAMFCDEKKPNA